MCIFKIFWAHPQNCEKRLLTSPCLFVHLSLRLSFLSILTEQLGSHWTEFHDTLYCQYFPKICRGN